PEGPRLAARAREREGARRGRAARDARRPPGLRGRRQAHEGPGRPRAAPLRDPEARRKPGALVEHARVRAVLHAEPLVADDRLQGTAAPGPDSRLLLRPGRLELR